MLFINLIVILRIILRIAFFTLLERKMLAYIQLRKGPNKVIIIGAPQPIADAIKLLIKEWVKPSRVNRWIFTISPIIILILALIIWTFIPFKNTLLYFQLTFLIFLVIISLNVYPSLTRGWVSNSKYASIGALRAIAQTISYEITMAIAILTPLIIILSFNSNKIIELQQSFWMSFIIPSIFIIWLIAVIAETNRTPFDLVEGESELVSGFNVEYRSVGFTLIFIAEYVRILLISVITTILFIGGTFSIINNSIIIIIKTLLIAALLIWVRGTMPRIRYDILIKLTWIFILPISIAFIIWLTPIIANH